MTEKIEKQGHDTVNVAAEEPVSVSAASRLNSAAVIILYAIVVFATLAYGAVETWSVGFISVATGVLVALWLIDGARRSEFRLDANVLQLFIAGLIVIGVVQLLPFRSSGVPGLSIPAASSISIDPYATWNAVVLLVIQLIFFAAAYALFNNADRVKRLAVFVVTFAALLAFFGILQRLANPQGIYGWRPTPQAIPFGSYVNQHHFAALMEMSIGLTLGILLGRATKKDKRLLLVIALVLMTIAIGLTGSRGGVLSLVAVAGFAVIFLFGRRSKIAEDEPSPLPGKWTIAAFGGLFAVFLVAALLFLGGDESLLRGIGITSQDDASSGRFHFWWVAVQIFKDYPVLGAGLDAFGTAFPQYDTWNGAFRVEQAHNDYLQILSDAGIAGFACVAAFVYFLFRKGFAIIGSENEPHRRSIAIGALAGCFGILVHSFFDFPLRTPANAFFFLLLVVLATTTVRFPRHRHRHRR